MVEEVMDESTKESQPARTSAASERARTRVVATWRSVSGALQKPAIGAGVAGATVLAAGALWGVTEALVAGVAAWAVFRALKKRATPEEAPAPAAE